MTTMARAWSWAVCSPGSRVAAIVLFDRPSASRAGTFRSLVVSSLRWRWPPWGPGVRVVHRIGVDGRPGCGNATARGRTRRWSKPVLAQASASRGPAVKHGRAVVGFDGVGRSSTADGARRGAVDGDAASMSSVVWVGGSGTSITATSGRRAATSCSGVGSMARLTDHVDALVLRQPGDGPDAAARSRRAGITPMLRTAPGCGVGK